MNNYKINVNYISKKIEQANKLKGLAIGNAERRFEINKDILIEELNEHPITREIEGGPDAPSQTLEVGNLFSFIGFNAGDKPIDKLRTLLMSEIRMIRTPTAVSGNNKIIFQFKVKVPNDTMLARETPMPEWSDGSWITKIENGISGLEYYLFGRFFRGSRSGAGIQIKNKVRSSVFNGIPYLSKILENFRKRL